MNKARSIKEWSTVTPATTYTYPWDYMHLNYYYVISSDIDRIIKSYGLKINKTRIREDQFSTNFIPLNYKIIDLILMIRYLD